MSLTVLFWGIIILVCLWLSLVTYVWVELRQHTRNHARRIGRLEISVEDLWKIIKGDGD